MKIKRNNLCVARVINEDDDYMLIEVLKNEDKKVHLDENPDNNRFLTIIFIRQEDGGGVVWKPWEVD